MRKAQQYRPRQNSTLDYNDSEYTDGSSGRDLPQQIENKILDHADLFKMKILVYSTSISKLIHLESIVFAGRLFSAVIFPMRMGQEEDIFREAADIRITANKLIILQSRIERISDQRGDLGSHPSLDKDLGHV